MKRHKTSLSHYRLSSMYMGNLIPIGCVEVLPGDTFQHATTALIRLSPLLAPIMHPVHVKIHHWFVPHRLTWDSWENFITGGPDGLNSSVFPTIQSPASVGYPIGSLADYFGIPTGVADLPFSALPFRAYAKIFNEWYRDQDLVDPVAVSTADGADSTTNTSLLVGAWNKDYFTTARPDPQKGPDVTIPMSLTAPVEYSFAASGGTPNVLRQASTGTVFSGNAGTLGVDAAGDLERSGSTNLVLDPGTSLQTDLSGAPGLIRDLREAFAIQRYEEARSRYGSRYTEYLRYLGVRSGDARLQRPEYLGGGRQTIQFSEIIQTSAQFDAEGDPLGTPVGELRGHGIGTIRSNRYRRFFEEHGYVISLMTVAPIPIYMQGLHRHWNRRTKEDFFQKELQFIGQQEVLQKEIYAAEDPNEVFGYADRYSDYRTHPSYVTGEFRDSLDYWHMARDFASKPVLDDTFVTCVPTRRVFADQTQHDLQVMVNHSIQARRLVAPTGNSFVR